MSDSELPRDPPRRPPRRPPSKDRRAQSASRGQLWRTFRGFFSRPMAVARRDGRVHVVFVDRRKAGALAPLRAELLARLKVYAQDHSSRSIRELALVHRMLGLEGWAGVEDLDQRLLGRALDQAERLRGRKTSDFLESVIAQLRALWLAAVHREQLRADAAEPAGPRSVPQVEEPPTVPSQLDDLR